MRRGENAAETEGPEASVYCFSCSHGAHAFDFPRLIPVICRWVLFTAIRNASGSIPVMVHAREDGTFNGQTEKRRDISTPRR